MNLYAFFDGEENYMVTVLDADLYDIDEENLENSLPMTNELHEYWWKNERAISFKRVGDEIVEIPRDENIWMRDWPTAERRNRKFIWVYEGNKLVKTPIIHTPLDEEIRSERNRLLTQSDWTQLPDVPESIRQNWTVYRQALRDIPQQSGFPETVVWPTPPN